MELSTSESHLVFDSIETALFDLGRYSEVEKFYRKVLENNSKDLNAGLRLANVLNEKGENKAAINLTDSFINEENPSILLMLMKKSMLQQQQIILVRLSRQLRKKIFLEHNFIQKKAKLME